jgi:sugar phosphate isomerase/epimerase
MGTAVAGLLHSAAARDLKLGITTDEVDEDLEVAARFIRGYNLEYAEIRNIWGKYNTAHPLDRVREARALLDRHKVRTSVLATGFFKIPLPEETSAGRGILDNQWSLLDTAMERAAIMGTDKIRTFAFTYKPGAKDEHAYARIYELVTEAARRAKARGFRLAVENVGDSYVWTGAESARLLAAVKADNLGLTWDPNNAAQAGEKSFPEGYKLLDAARIFHVHLRDFKPGPNGKMEWCAVGDGVMDNVGQIRALRKAGYKESFTLETHYKHPEGKAAASKTSMEALLKVVERV